MVLDAGTGSPVIMLSSTYDSPEVIVPSTGIFSPGFTLIVSPFSMDEIGTITASPSLTSVASFGCSPISLRIADEVLPLAFSSSNLPKRTNATIIVAAS
ncbi:hypothetical protein SDC9_113543 [bioreactor metagenome]|uniref:Uncharacterized protein n=1 Tax=bioreactor metagenome TaxID=1076179 RepID=A0A645BTR9_9ZZZZ